MMILALEVDPDGSGETQIPDEQNKGSPSRHVHSQLISIHFMMLELELWASHM